MNAHGPSLSVVLPAHNSGLALDASVSILADALADSPGAEVIIVENGSSDSTWELAQELAARDLAVPVVACQSPVGLGQAYAEGIRRATGDVVLLTADDLPFDMTDVASWERAGHPVGLVIGSKAHPQSQAGRGLLRRLMTAVFTVLRRIILAMPVGDTQGTIFVPAAWGKAVLPRLQERGYLVSTELLYAGQLQGLPITEVPVVLRPLEAHDGGTRIRVKDVVNMALGLVALRRRRRSLAAPLPGAPSA